MMQVMNLERDKFLTEAIGECWHVFVDDIFEDYPVLRCSVCTVLAENCSEKEFVYHNNFSTWEGFGKLWEWANKQEWWRSFSHHKLFDTSLDYVIPESIINPDRFANSVDSYLKELENVKRRDD